MAPVSGRLVPFSSWAEWSAVAAGLLCDRGDACVAALQRVATWRGRGGKLPLAVDCTALLVEASLQDTAFGPCVPPYSPLSEAGLRSLYALAVVRLVNGVTDPQQKGRFAAPVATLARNAGLPPLLVDVRHETAHNALPSLATLRTACGLALQWCAARYWDPQQRCCDDQQSATAAAVAELLSACALGVSTSRHDGSTAGRGAGGDPGMLDEAADEWLVNEGDDAQPQQAHTPSAIRRRRGAALRAVGEAVPLTGVQLLVSAVLDEGDGGHVSAQPHGTDAWRDALHILARRYPALPWLLLSGSVRRLIASGGSSRVSTQVATRVRDLAPIMVGLATSQSDQACLTPARVRSLRMGLAKADTEAPVTAAAAAALAAALNDLPAAAPVAAGTLATEDIAAAEAEVQAMKRRRKAGGGVSTGDAARGERQDWSLCPEWPPCAVGAPPGWLLTREGHPPLHRLGGGQPEQATGFSTIVSCLFPTV